MSISLREILINYRTEPLSGDKVHITARKRGKIVFNGYYQIYGSIETNYSRLTVIWPEDGVVPAEYRDYYGLSNNMYPVDIEYFVEDDIVHFSGDYFGSPYRIVIQLPEKRYLD